MNAAAATSRHDLGHSLLWPLSLFYTHHARQLPEITPLLGQHLPAPYKELLVHKRNMTPTLEAFHHSSLHIECLNVLPGPGDSTREVILRTDGDKKPVEYGASRIFLQSLTPKALKLIDAGELPLGTILHTCDCQHTVEPSGFFKIKPTPFFNQVFGTFSQVALYGRRNTLVALDGTPVAEVCEVLPPMNGEAINGVAL